MSIPTPDLLHSSCWPSLRDLELRTVYPGDFATKQLWSKIYRQICYLIFFSQGVKNTHFSEPRFSAFKHKGKKGHTDAVGILFNSACSVSKLPFEYKEPNGMNLLMVPFQGKILSAWVQPTKLSSLFSEIMYQCSCKLACVAYCLIRLSVSARINSAIVQYFEKA